MRGVRINQLLRVLPFVLVVLLLSSFVLANPVSLHVQGSGELDFNGLAVLVSIDNSDSEFVSELSADNINLSDVLSPATLTVHTTANKKYVGHFNPGDSAVILKPVAQLSGYVMDSKSNLIQHAGLVISCSGSSPELYPSETDDLGFFSIDELTFGDCEINVIVEKKVYSYFVDINESKHYVLEAQISPDDDFKFTGPILLILILLTVSIFLGRKTIISQRIEKKKQDNVKEDSKLESKVSAALGEKSQTSQTKKGFSERQQDILLTFSEKEREVVNQLFYENSGLTQSQIRHRTGIPKSSLHRILSLLENKHITIQIEQNGLKKVELTEFFLNGS